MSTGFATFIHSTRAHQSRALVSFPLSRLRERASGPAFQLSNAEKGRMAESAAATGARGPFSWMPSFLSTMTASSTSCRRFSWIRCRQKATRVRLQRVQVMHRSFPSTLGNMARQFHARRTAGPCAVGLGATVSRAIVEIAIGAYNTRRTTAGKDQAGYGAIRSDSFKLFWCHFREGASCVQCQPMATLVFMDVC